LAGMTDCVIVSSGRVPGFETNTKLKCSNVQNKIKTVKTLNFILVI